MLQLGQLHLQLAFEAARALGEDVQDQPGAVEHAALEELLQVAFLARAQRMVDQDQVGAGGIGRGLDLVQLAAADLGRRTGLVHARGDHRGDGRAGGTGQVGEFLLRAVIGRTPAGTGAHGLYQQGVSRPSSIVRTWVKCGGGWEDYKGRTGFCFGFGLALLHQIP